MSPEKKHFTSKKWFFALAQGANRELPSLMSTKILPASPREIRSSSRYVVSSHDSALLFEIENFHGG